MLYTQMSSLTERRLARNRPSGDKERRFAKRNLLADSLVVVSRRSATARLSGGLKCEISWFS
jgi:hypothetical protein